jgi:predicted O-methyltransferase YrrM
MATGAVRWLDRNLSSDMTLLELGAGASTSWYAARVGRVVSVEPNEDWHRRVASSLKDLANVELVADTIRSALERYKPTSFDVVVVDHTETERDLKRLDVIAGLGQSVRIIVLDDSDRASYAGASEVMLGWTAERHVSYRGRPLSPTETTIFTRAMP